MKIDKELEMKEIQHISLEILDIIVELCEKLNLRYFLFYGTLIGAVRHKGYIPWDDDLDIMMPRKDHDILMEYLRQHIFDYKNIEVFNYEINKDYPYMITRISDNRYKIIMENEEDYGMGVFIDIYPFDGLGNTKEEALKYGTKGDILSSLCYQATRKRYAIETTSSTLRKFLKFPIFFFSKLCGKDIFQNRLQKLARVKSYDESEYVGCVVWLSGGEKDIFPRKWFDDYEMMKFGEKVYRVPKEYNNVLRHIYGDYMKLPPVEDRVGHHNYKVVIR